MTLLIKNAHIVDGSGSEPFRGDILVSEDRITAIGTLTSDHADVVIDCHGAYVAPGFIDIHGETDHHGNLLAHPLQEHYIVQGITSVVGGHSGHSLAPLLHGKGSLHKHFGVPRGVNSDWQRFREFLASFSRRPTGINFGSLIGFSTIRTDIAGEDRTLVKGELHVARRMMHEALSEGALGISLDPRAMIGKSELVIIAEVLRDHGILALSAEHYSALQKAKLQTRALIYDASALPVPHGAHYDVAPYAFVQTSVSALLPEWLLKKAPHDILEELRDEWFRKKVGDDLPDIQPASIRILYMPHDQSLSGMSLATYMEHRGIRNAKEGFLDLVQRSALKARIVNASSANDARVMKQLLQSPDVLIGSRELGSYPAVWHSIAIPGSTLMLLHDIEQGGIMPIQTFIKRLTHDPAVLFELEGRGLIREGKHADIIIFKNNEIRYTIVNGHVAYDRGKLSTTCAGIPLVTHSSML